MPLSPSACDRQSDTKEPSKVGPCDENGENRPPLDLEHLSRYTLSDRNLEREILDLFCEQLPKSLEALRQAKTQKEWQIASHTLKGSARTIGAWRLANIAAMAEVAAEKRPNGRQESALLADLTTAAEEATQYIAQMLDN